jgi:hypothetical protein
VGIFDRAKTLIAVKLLRLLKRVICYTKLVFSLKWLGLSAGEISRLNTIAYISKNNQIQENGLIFRDNPR